MENKKVPQLRFSGFKKIENEKLKDENWFSAPASEIFISVNDRNHPELPVLSASQELGMIYRDEGGMNIFHDVANEITYKRVKPGQFVIHLRSFQGGFAHSKVEGITSPAYTILDFKDRNKHNDLFWKYVLTSEEFIKRLELITYGIRDGRSINFSDFSTLNFYFPSYEVQQKIGTFLSHVDSLIQAKTKKLESLKAVKKSLLQKCFPKAGEKVPEMRFAGFSGDWEEKKLGDLIVEINERTSNFNNYELFSLTIENGITKKTERYERSFLVTKEEDLFKIVHTNNFVTNPMNFRFGAIGYSKEVKDISVSGYYDVFSIENNTSSNFWYYYFKTDSSLKRFDDVATGSLIEKRRVKLSTLKQMSFICPSKDEKIKIGQFFSKYDSLISLQKKEIENLKTIKKSLLQKMFV